MKDCIIFYIFWPLESAGHIMRTKLLSEGASELTYEIREIVKKADQLRKLGKKIIWENIGDPIQKNCEVPAWIKDIVQELAGENKSYGYCHSKGVLETRKYLADLNNQRTGTKISEDDILFFNGMGDAISKVYQYLLPTARVIGPSPAYSTHSSSEAAHANHHPITYRLDPENNWYPDLEDLYNQVKYNPNIVGILIINPDNPTGMVYPLETLQKMVAIAKEFKLFLLSDEIYHHITYNDVRAYSLSEVIGDVPGIALKGISKEIPWPGSRCGWLEYYNRDKDEEFSQLCKTLDNAKMIEVCSTTLPQLAIPRIMSHPQYWPHRKELNGRIGERSLFIQNLFKDVPGVIVNPTHGAFYQTLVFRKGTLNQKQKLDLSEAEEQLVQKWVQNVKPDSRLVYYILAAKGICVVPLTSFCSDLEGFRVTLLEENREIFESTFRDLKDAILNYLKSA
jgi:alanine-synthesizing transaminase